MNAKQMFARGTCVIDQWSTLKNKCLMECPNSVLVRGFNAACVAEEAISEATEHASMMLLSALILRCELHGEILRRLKLGLITVTEIDAEDL